MSAITSIEWTDRTWNPVTGCTKVSQGCKNCYAETIANRFWKDRKFTDVRVHPERLGEPLRWRKPSRIFVNSMSDLFHEDVPDEFIMRVFDVMDSASRHTFQILTKRPERMLHVMKNASPISNVWLGVSVEDQKTADERIPILLQTQAAVRFVSYEPALGPVDFRSLKVPSGDYGFFAGHYRKAYCELDSLHSMMGIEHRGQDPLSSKINWLIVGGESGPGARPCNIEWIRSAVKQCQEAGVPVFVKQLGAWPMQSNAHPIRLKNRKGGDPSEWPEDLRIREFPQ